MGDQVNENINIETSESGTLNNVKKFEVGKSKLSDKEIQEATIQADELERIEKSFETNKTTQGTESDETKQIVLQKNSGTLSPDIKNDIKKLNGPVAQKGLETANDMNTMNQSIQNSKLPRRIKQSVKRVFKK